MLIMFYRGGCARQPAKECRLADIGTADRKEGFLATAPARPSGNDGGSRPATSSPRR
jgi:hypothetical protein